LFLRNRHYRRFTGEEFDSAGGASRVASTGVELIATDLLSQSIHEAFACGDFEFSNTLDSKFWHRKPFQIDQVLV
jgi:hypothetical protein